MNWLKYRYLYFTLSLLVLIPGIFSLLSYGLNPSIDFTGGSHIVLNVDSPDQTTISDTVNQYTTLESISINASQVTLTTPTITQDTLASITGQLNQHYTSVDTTSFSAVGPSAGRQLVRQTLTAASLAILAILLYIAYAFKNLKYGLAAILAMLHDTFILLGTFSLLGHFFDLKVDLLFVTAVLTTLSFSVHDTIVVFDHIRFLKSRHRDYSFNHLSNQAITDTLIRSLNNSMTIIFMLLALFVLGGPSLRNFSLALLVGAITGTYSSTFTAVPLLSLWLDIKKRFNLT